MSLPVRRRVTAPVGSKFASPKAVVQQHLAKDADINTIVAKAKRGIAPSNARGPGVFADVSQMPKDLTEAFALVDQAWDSFSALPAKAREELDNDPRRLVKQGPEFFLRHGLMIPKEAPGVRQDAPEGAGEGSPASASKKGSKGAKAPKVDDDSQD